MAVETVWDAANVAMGVGSFMANVAAGNVGGAALDAVGVILDSAATVTPCVPGGAGTAIKLLRGADKATDLLKAADKANDIRKAADKTADVFKGAEKLKDAKDVGAKTAKRTASESGAQADGIVYKRTNPKTGEEYVGQSKSPERFDARQREHDKNLGAQHEYEVLARGKAGKELDKLEEDAIRSQGGLRKEGGKLDNRRHQMSESRYREAGGKLQKVERPKKKED